jgi:hypothetical protein
MSHIPDHIENPAAWEAGRTRRIMQNRRITGQRKMDAAHPGLRLRIQFGYKVDAEGQPIERTYDDGTVGYVVDERGPRFPDWMHDALDKWGGLTEKQTAVALKIIERHEGRTKARDEAEAHRQATAPHWEAGRVEVEGVIRSARFEVYEVGYAQSGSYKALIALDDGRLLWSSLPGAVGDELMSDHGPVNEWPRNEFRVAFTVRVEPKDTDPTFGFGRRPTKGRVVRKEEK